MVLLDIETPGTSREIFGSVFSQNCFTIPTNGTWEKSREISIYKMGGKVKPINKPKSTCFVSLFFFMVTEPAAL